MRRLAIAVLIPALALGAAACTPKSGSGSSAASAVGSIAPSAAASVRAAARAEAETLSGNKALQADEFTALRKIDTCAGKQGWTFTVTNDPHHPIAHVRVAHLSDMFHPIEAVAAAAKCAAPPGEKANVIKCVKALTITGITPLAVEAAKCVVAPPQ